MEIKKFNELISRYWEGESSLEEEFQLRQYLNTDEGKSKHPEEASMFGFFSMQRDIKSSLTEFPVEKLDTPTPKVRSLNSLTFVRNIAAAVLILLGAYFVWNQNSVPPEKNQLAENWREVEDPKEALKITKEALAFLSNKVDKSERLLKNNIAKLSVNNILKK